MPLVKSKSPEAFRKNVKAEVAAGKPVKQAWNTCILNKLINNFFTVVSIFIG